MESAALEAVFPALGTTNSIRIFRFEDRAAAGEALGRAKARVCALHDRLSVYQPESELSLLNAAAGCAAIPVGEDTLFLLSQSKRYSRLSGGAFSVSTRPLSALWEIHARCGTVPSRVEVEQSLSLVCDEDILLDERAGTAELCRFGQSVDFGGIAKGYAADEARRILLDGGVTSALLNFGGTVVSIGDVRHVGIQHPDRYTGVAMGRVALEDACAVTSGDYERYYEVDGVRYHHIVDPRTGYPSRSTLRSVTLLCGCALELDALSTAVFVLGEQEGLRLVQQAGAEAVFVTDKLDVFCTEGLRGNFELL
ncbi:MAG: FAD:protein FMN transferase [Clostridiales bacterium]|nr:FAD:protein FMN transferase [Clostridiales bacterium]